MEPCAARHTLCGQQHGWERLSHSLLLGEDARKPWSCAS